MNLREVILKELSGIKNSSRVNQNILKKFHLRITGNAPLLKTENTPDHVCSFFLPVHKETKSIYLVHHIKAQSWIPPGGHIDPGETPRETVRREFREELDFSLTDEPVTLVGLSIKYIDSIVHPCKVHYDLWYTVSCRKRYPFRYLEKEFYNAGWFDFRTGVSKIEHRDYQSIVRNLDLEV